MQILMNNEVEEFKNNNLTQKYNDDFGYDIRAGGTYIIPPQTNVKIYTGLRVHIPKELGGIIQSRSGLAFKEDMEASNAGVIDSGYHNLCWIKIYNQSNNQTREINKGDRCGQMIFHINPKHFIEALNTVLGNLDKSVKFKPFEIIEAKFKDFPKSSRDVNGLGSSGKS